MALDLDFQRGYRTLATRSPERGAVLDATPFVKAYAQDAASQRLRDASAGMSVRGMEAETAFARDDMRMARRDSGAALGAQGLTLGGQMLANRERKLMQDAAERRMEEENDRWRAMEELMLHYGDEIIRRLRVEPASDYIRRG